MGRRANDLAGHIYGLWTAIERAGRRGNDATWHCRCRCGTEREVSGAHLVSGKSRSCGCTRTETQRAAVTTHGMEKTRIYKIWQQMKQRCSNPKAPNYAEYGGRGIRVCQEWEDSFESFFSDMGHPPSDDHTLDRRENDGHYTKLNCRWATRSEQQRNKRNSRSITFRGETKNVVEWAELYGLHYTTLAKRVFHLGWDIERALTTPTR